MSFLGGQFPPEAAAAPGRLLSLLEESRLLRDVELRCSDVFCLSAAFRKSMNEDVTLKTAERMKEAYSPGPQGPAGGAGYSRNMAGPVRRGRNRLLGRLDGDVSDVHHWRSQCKCAFEAWQK